jgi:hypothetical protein
MNELTSLGEFRNIHGELFVVLTTRETKELYIIGDETAWEPVRIDGDFIFSPAESTEVQKIVKEFAR